MRGRNQFIFGLMIGIGGFFLMGAVNQQVSLRYNDESLIAREFQNVYNVLQSKEHRLSRSNVIPTTIKEGEMVIVSTSTDLGGTKALFTKIDGSTWSLNMSRN